MQREEEMSSPFEKVLRVSQQTFFCLFNKVATKLRILKQHWESNQPKHLPGQGASGSDFKLCEKQVLLKLMALTCKLKVGWFF